MLPKPPFLFMMSVLSFLLKHRAHWHPSAGPTHLKRLNKRAEWTKHFTLHQSSSHCPKCSLPEWSCLKLSPLLESSEAIVFNKDQAAGSQIKQRDKENLISREPLNLKWCCLAARRGAFRFGFSLYPLSRLVRFPARSPQERRCAVISSHLLTSPAMKIYITHRLLLQLQIGFCVYCLKWNNMSVSKVI